MEERPLAIADRCLAAELAAWEELYAKCQGPLCTAIRDILPRKYSSSDPNLVDEIAARIWYTLVKNDGEILAKLTTFIRDLVTQATLVEEIDDEEGMDVSPGRPGDEPTQ